MTPRIHAPERTLADQLQQRIDNKTKPQGAAIPRSSRISASIR